MKKLYFILLAVVLAGCNFTNIEITGTATGMDGSTVSIRDNMGKIIYGENIVGGKFHIVQQPLKESGYYKLSVSTSGSRGGKNFEVYLEPGKYNIQLGADKKYPVITTSSETQNELSQYYHFTDSIRKNITNEYELEKNKLNAKLDAARKSNAPESITKKIYDDLEANEMMLIGLHKNVLEKFVDKYPNSGVITRILYKADYESDPVKYYAIFKKLTKEVQSNKEGKKIEEALGHLIDLQPGKMAPKIEGTTPDGKTVDLKAMGKKIILIEFWRASTIEAINRHPEMNALSSKLGVKGLGIVSVSFDPDKERWLNYIDGLNWTQVSDQKGLDSPNAKNWGITQLPIYCLVDAQGKLIEWNISYGNAVFNITNYLAED